MTYKKLWYSCSQSPTILVKTFGTLRVLGEENVIQVDSLPPEQCWVLQVKHLLHILYTLQTLRTSTLFSGGGGGNLVKALFKSVYRRLAANSYRTK